MPLFPYVQIVGLGVLIAVLITMGLDKEVWGISWIVGVPWIALLSIFYFARKANRARNPAGTPIEEPRP
jgi:L-asparagine transporter-like permease